MKTTIEIKGYEIVIEETEDGVTVMAVQDGETVEEFTLEGEVDVKDDGMKSFGEEDDEEDDFDGADEYEDDMDELGQDEEEEEDDDDFEEEEGFGAKVSPDEEEEGEEERKGMPAAQAAPKMESFGDFVRRNSKTRRARR